MLGDGAFLIRFLLEEGDLTPEDVDAARADASARGVSVEDALVSTSVIAGHQLAIARAALLECPYVDLSHFTIDNGNAALLPREVAEACAAFPLFVTDAVATVGMEDPLDLASIDRLRQVLRREIDAVLCERDELQTLIGQAYSLSGAGAASVDTHERNELTTGDEPIVAAVNHILHDAADAGASDVHISPEEREVQLRVRIDGRLRDKQAPPRSSHNAIVQRLKVMGGLDLTQTRRPQDGKFRFKHRGQAIEVRLSTIPTVNGENVVMRLLRPNAEILDFAVLGMREHDVEAITDIIEHPHGLLLVTGPTGSGKTSTLFAALRRLNTPERNVMTIEDPVEIRLDGVRQVQCNAEIGLDFAKALRSILRQDPDVVLVGEIRDQETASIAMQASLTGHLVLSTLHTNDAPSAIARLRDLGAPSFVIASSLLGVLGQRLVRRVCDACAEPTLPEAHLAQRFNLDVTRDRFLTGAGCSRCNSSGYRGRIGIYELLRVTPELASLIDQDATTRAIEAAAIEQAMTPMWRDGVDKARLGLTTLAEVVRVAATTSAPETSEHDEPVVREAAA